MHTIEPFYQWRDYYIASEDPASPFYGVQNSDMYYTHAIYNYLIHPQWDEFGSETLYGKLLFADYEAQFAILEFIGEWNDTLNNDVESLYLHVIQPLIESGIRQFACIIENVLDFHGSDDEYYREWYESISEEGGWICMLDPLKHVLEEMEETGICNYVRIRQDIRWRRYPPQQLQKILMAPALNSSSTQPPRLR